MANERNDPTAPPLEAIGPSDRPHSLLEGHPPATVLGPGTCILCHTIDHAVSEAALAAGGGWKCARCGQRWDAARLAAAAFVRDRDRSH
jgi:hypothetical protein